jgi:hypothetical protein
MLNYTCGAFCPKERTKPHAFKDIYLLINYTDSLFPVISQSRLNFIIHFAHGPHGGLGLICHFVLISKLTLYIFTSFCWFYE